MRVSQPVKRRQRLNAWTGRVNFRNVENPSAVGSGTLHEPALLLSGHGIKEDVSKRSPVSLPSALSPGRYRPGEVVPTSGIYRAAHTGHRDSHEGMLLGGESFPACRLCRGAVLFDLVQMADALSEDPDFGWAAPGLERRAA